MYVGDWKDNQMDGEGVLRLASGEKFKGSFLQGKKHGKCIEEYSDGTRFEGYYKNGEKDGPFVERDANGNVTRRGTYENGRVVPQ